MPTDDIISTLVEEYKIRKDWKWCDEDTTKKIEFFIRDSIVDIARFTGDNDFDYLAPSVQKSLMFTRCQYALEDMLDDFYKNYSSEITALHTRTRVNRYASKKAESDTHI